MSLDLPPVKESIQWKQGLCKLVFNWRVAAVGFVAGAYLLDNLLHHNYDYPRQSHWFRSPKPSRHVYDN